MADQTPEARKPKSAYYRLHKTGEVLQALRTPVGYEDDHPELFEPCEAPVPKAKPVVAPVPAPVTAHASGAPVSIVPLAPAPQT